MLFSEKDVANNIRIIREARGLSQVELAERSGLSRSTIQSIEVMRVSPTVRALFAIAHALDVDVVAFFKGDA